MIRLLLLVVLLLPLAAPAAAISVDTHGGRATGVGTAVAATVSDPSAIFYNPAGILLAEGTQLQLGDTAILASLHFSSLQSGAQTAVEPVPSLPPHVYATMRLGDRFGVGVGLFVNYGNSARWPSEWEYRGRALQSSLATFNLNPEFAYRITDWLRVGAGLQVIRANVSTQRALNFLDQQAQVTLVGSGVSFGANAGVQADFWKDRVSVGLAWRSSVRLQLAGVARFDDVPPEAAGTAHDQPARAYLRLPDTVFAGVAVRPLDRLTVSADAHYFRWSVFDRLTVQFPEDPSLNQILWKRWRDTISWHLGAEYQLLPNLALRVGAVYDPTPSPEDTLTMDLPDSTRLKGALGVGYTWQAATVDVGYQYVHLLGSTSTAPGYEGRYGGHAHLVSATLGYRF